MVRVLRFSGLSCLMPMLMVNLVDGNFISSENESWIAKLLSSLIFGQMNFSGTTAAEKEKRTDFHFKRSFCNIYLAKYHSDKIIDEIFFIGQFIQWILPKTFVFSWKWFCLFLKVNNLASSFFLGKPYFFLQHLAIRVVRMKDDVRLNERISFLNDSECGCWWRPIGFQCPKMVISV